MRNAGEIPRNSVPSFGAARTESRCCDLAMPAPIPLDGPVMTATLHVSLLIKFRFVLLVELLVWEVECASSLFYECEQILVDFVLRRRNQGVGMSGVFL